MESLTPHYSQKNKQVLMQVLFLKATGEAKIILSFLPGVEQGWVAHTPVVHMHLLTLISCTKGEGSVGFSGMEAKQGQREAEVTPQTTHAWFTSV